MSSNTTITTYDPTGDTVDIIITGLLPLILLGLYKGFEDGKKIPFSFINVFDDFIIFTSIIIFPFITGIEWYPYFNEFNKHLFIVDYIFIIVGGSCLYVYYYYYYKRYNNPRKGFYPSIFFAPICLTTSPILGYTVLIYEDDIPSYLVDFFNNVPSNDGINNYCKENFTYDKCDNLRISTFITYSICLGVAIVNFLNIFYYRGKKFGTLGTICSHLVMIILIVYPAIISGWLFSTNSVTTKISFGICSISLSRLFEHSNKPEEINTIISNYLNPYKWMNKEPTEEIKTLGKEIMERNKRIADLTGKIGMINKETKRINETTEEIKKQTEEIQKQAERLERLTGGIEEPTEDVRKLAEEIKEKAEKMENEINEMAKQAEGTRTKLLILSSLRPLFPIEEYLMLRIQDIEGQTKGIKEKTKGIDEKIKRIDEEMNEIGKKIKEINEIKKWLENNGMMTVVIGESE